MKHFKQIFLLFLHGIACSFWNTAVAANIFFRVFNTETVTLYRGFIVVVTFAIIKFVVNINQYFYISISMVFILILDFCN